MEGENSVKFKPKIAPTQVRKKLAQAQGNKVNSKVANHGEGANAAKEAQAAQKPKKTKKKAEGKGEEKTTVAFPVDSRTNAYGFIYMRAKWLEALGWQKGMKLSINKNPDGSLTVRKA